MLLIDAGFFTPYHADKITVKGLDAEATIDAGTVENQQSPVGGAGNVSGEG